MMCASLSRCVRGIQKSRGRMLAAAEAHQKTDHKDHRYRNEDGPVGVEFHLAQLLPRPSGLGSPSRTLTALLGGHPRRPNLATNDAAQLAARNRRRVLLSDRLGGSLTGREVHNGLGELVGVPGHLGSLHLVASISAFIASICRRSFAGRRVAPFPARFSQSHRLHPLWRCPLWDFSFMAGSIAAGMRKRQPDPGFKLSHYRSCLTVTSVRAPRRA